MRIALLMLVTAASLAAPNLALATKPALTKSVLLSAPLTGQATPNSAGKAKRPLRREQLGSRKAQLRTWIADTQSLEARSGAPAAAVRISSETGPCPKGMVAIGQEYCIDTYEAALLEVLPDGTEHAWSPYHQLRSGVVVRAISEPGLVPQGYISGTEAAEACRLSGKRLCKPTEWQKACMGPAKTLFPYGAKRQNAKCNDHGRSSMQFYNKGLTDRPEDGWRWGFNGNMLDPRLNALEGTLARTGEHAECTNEFGVYDMVGNLHEWVDDPYGTFQGGYYLDTHLNGDGCAYRTTAHDVRHKDYSTGFRCCADTESR